MRCEDCRGHGKFAVLRLAGREATVAYYLPCSSCNGTGQQSCCEGMCGNAVDVTNTGEDRDHSPS